jgi:hypothetical protein
MAERTRQPQYIGGIIVYILNRHGGSNLRIFWEVYIMSPLNILSPLRLFIETMPINKAVERGNGNRILTQKLHVQIANNPQSPQCQTEAQLLSSSRPP